MMASQPKAVEYFVPEHSALPHTMRGRLHEQVQQEARGLVDGVATDWPDYKRRIGRIQGLKDALKICEDAEKDLNR